MKPVRDNDLIIGAWLEDGPLGLPAETRQAITVGIRTVTRRNPGIGWRFLRLPTIDLRRLSVALGSAVVAVLAVGLALNVYLNQQGHVGPAPSLPSSPTDWSRVSVESRFATAQLDTFATSPRGLLALVGELGTNAFQLVVSVNGQEWTQVPSNQHPSLEGHNVELAGTDRGFLMLVDNDLWGSADGLNWDGLAGSVTDPALSQGDVLAVAAGGPGFVAVGGNNKAWHSTNGTDWSLAEVPPPPTEVFERPGIGNGGVWMQGVAIAGDRLVAWGQADNGFEPIPVPVIWTSTDGLSWANAPDLQMDYVMAVAGGPNGFVAIGADVSDNADARYTAWFSADGRVWQEGDGFTSLDDQGVPMPISVKSVTATRAGYVAVGANNQCLVEPCQPIQHPLEAVVWASADGLSWSRLPSNDLFSVNEPRDPESGGSDATAVAAWESDFVIGGHFDGKPVVWISGSEPAGSGASDGTTPPPAIPTPTREP